MPIVEVSDDGVLRLPSQMVAGAEPHAKFELEHIGNVTLLRPVSASASLPPMTPAERVAAFERWVASPRPPAPDLPAECLRREHLYD